MARNKRILVEVDPNQWAALKGQAATEGRFVRVVLGEAIAGYLARFGAPLTFKGIPLVWDNDIRNKPSVEELRALVTAVPRTDAEAGRVRPETARERLERESARREWLRTHPEEEGQ